MLSPLATAIVTCLLLLGFMYAAALGFAWLSRRAATQLAARFTTQSLDLLRLAVLIIVVAFAASLLVELAEEVTEADEIVAVDEAFANIVTPYHTPVLINVFKGITALGGWEGVYLFGVAASALFWYWNKRQLIAPFWITVWGAQLTTLFGKVLIGRERPEFVAQVIEHSASFPSGHSTAAMATYGFIAYACSKQLSSWRHRFEVLFWAGVLIFVIGFSRIFLSVHYASDVAAGFLVGAIWLLSGIAVSEWLEVRRARKIAETGSCAS